MKKISSSRGFTLIEVMFTLLIFMVAITGLIALQKVSSDGSHRGKRLTAAVNLADFFLTQLQTEFSGWTFDGLEPTSYPAMGFPANQYPLLDRALGSGAGGTGTWLSIDDSNFRIDQYMGHSFLDASSDGTSRFCVNYSLTPLQTITGAIGNDVYVVWRAHVRVSWPKGGQFQVSEGWKDCTPSSVEMRVVTEGIDDAVELVAVLSREF